ncbi:MAG: adenylate kinase [Bifidobacteriaceae bacterium]|nr:adenylate kinase [Bifidobacteriaceae bacterium]
MKRRLVLLGPPGSGKGTQGSLLASHLGVPTVSTGALFRDQMARGTALGVEAATYMAQGHLVPDRVVNAMVRSRFSSPDAEWGFILDGYPRNVPQVGVLDAILAERGLAVEAAVCLELPEDLIVTRLLRRAELEGRVDDTEPVIRERLAVYHRETEPIVAVYRARGLLVPVDAVGTVEDVAGRVLGALGAAAGVGDPDLAGPDSAGLDLAERGR